MSLTTPVTTTKFSPDGQVRVGDAMRCDAMRLDEMRESGLLLATYCTRRKLAFSFFACLHHITSHHIIRAEEFCKAAISAERNRMERSFFLLRCTSSTVDGRDTYI